MKKFYLLFLALISFVAVSAQNLEVNDEIFRMPAAPAAEGENVFGYCLEDSYQYLRYKDAGVSGTQIYAAICIPSEIATQLQGDKISKIRIGFKNPLRKDVEVFVKESLDGAAIFSKKNQRLRIEGWNEVTVDTPVEITGKDLYVGFSYRYYFNNDVALALVDMSTENDNAKWLKIGDKEWNNTDMKGLGALLIQIVTTGGKTVAYDLGMENIITPTSIKGGVDTEIKFVARNFGGKDVNGYKIEYTIDGAKKTLEFDNVIKPMKTDTVKVMINVSEPNFGLHHIVAKTIAPENDATADNDVVEKDLVVYGQSLPQKKVLVEEYLGMECSACYPVSFHMDTIFNKCNGNVVFMNHHAYKGNRYDCFALFQSVEYSWYFGLKAAPSVAMDRVPFNIDGVKSTLLSGVDKLDLGMTANDMIAKDCYTSIDITSEYDESTREVKIKISGIKLLPLNLTYPVIQVYLLEDGQEYWQNAPGGIKDFVHNHIVRAFVTESTGYEISGDAGYYEAEFTYTIPEEMSGWDGENGGEGMINGGQLVKTTLNPENMYVVGIVANFNPSDPLDCAVVNANSCKLGETTVGVEATEKEDLNVYSYGSYVYVDGENQGVEVYSLQGNLVKNEKGYIKEINMSDQTDGLYLVRVKTAEGNKIYKLFINK